MASPLVFTFTFRALIIRMPNQINILPSAAIDKQKWDDCIRRSSNALLYASAFYLDHLAENWHGIVVDDYAAVMPVPWKRKMGIRYSYHVPFIQQLGLFTGSDNIAKQKIIDHLFRFVHYGDYYFNFTDSGISKQVLHNNYILNLSKPYETIAAQYNKDLLQNLKKSVRENLCYQHETVDNAVLLFRELYAARTPHVTGHDYENFLLVCKTLAQDNNAFARKITGENNEVLAVTLLLRDDRRIYNMMNSTPEAGRKTSANHLLFDKIFREFAGNNLLFDFEGSDIAGIKAFYEKFGPVNQPYASVHFNYLPFPMRFLKR